MTGTTGHASPEGTRAFSARATEGERLPAAHFRRAPGELTVSSIGLGTYLGRPDGPTDLKVEAAVRIAITSGRVNVIDTAINYRHQRAERSIGRALQTLFASGRVARSEVFVATKVGYLAPDGESPRSPSEWVREELIGTGVLSPDDLVDGSHAMSPSYVSDQIRRSRENLGLATIDLVYLHNAPDAQIPAIGLPTFLERLGAAAERLEEHRRRGEIGAYGLATWDSLRARPDDARYLPLEAALRVASEVGGERHGLRFVQFPLNLAFPEAVTFENQPIDGRRVTLLEAARQLGLGAFTSVPLLQGELARSGPNYGPLSRAASAVQWARSAPGTLGPVIGLKEPEHLSEVLGVASHKPWEGPEFASHLPRRR